MNKKLKIFCIIILVIFFAGIILPKIIIRDESPISFTPEQIKTAKQEARIFFDNPLERLLVVEFRAWSVSPKGGIEIDVYIWGGIKYALLNVDLEGNANIVWRRWFDGNSRP